MTATPAVMLMMTRQLTDDGRRQWCVEAKMAATAGISRHTTTAPANCRLYKLVPVHTE